MPNPLVVRATDAKGKDLKGRIVNFRVVEGGGQVFAGASITNRHGIAQERWTLGAFGPQRHTGAWTRAVATSRLISQARAMICS